MKLARWLLPLLLLGSGCAYYNGMYNTKRLAGRARKAEREGRTFDATSLWGQVSIKAESMLVRHPGSKWEDEARLLQGTAKVKLRDCESGLPLLEQVMVTTANPEFQERAAELVGGCRVTLGDPVGATAAYARLVNSHDPVRRSAALYAHGRALRIAGDHATALAELSGSTDPRAAGERAAALAGLGRSAEAAAMADSLLATNDTLVPWGAIVAGMDATDPPAAAALLERIVQHDSLPAALRARLLLEDGMRRAATDARASDECFRRTIALASRTPLESEARFERARLHAARTAEVSELRELLDGLADGEDMPGPFGPRLTLLAAELRQAVAAADSVAPGAPLGDLRLFTAAEFVRDTIGAPRLAAGLFGRIAREWPESPYAPKAIMALRPLDPAAGDSLLGVLHEQYGGSPYVQFAAGEAGARMAVLEDSLRRFMLSFRAEGVRRPNRRPTPAGRPQASPREPGNR